MEEHSDYAVSLLLKDYNHIMDGPNQGKNILKSTKWTDPTKVQDNSPHNGRTQPGSNLFKSTKWTDPTKGQHNSPHNGRTQPGLKTYSSPQSGRTSPRVKTQVQEMDGPNQGHKLIQSPRNEWTQPGS